MMEKGGSIRSGWSCWWSRAPLARFGFAETVVVFHYRPRVRACNPWRVGAYVKLISDKASTNSSYWDHTRAVASALYIFRVEVCVEGW